MSLFKKACAFLSVIAIASTSIITTTVMAEEVNPTVYMDYAIEESKLVITIKAKDCPVTYTSDGFTAPYCLQMAEVFVNIDAGAEGNYTLPSGNDVQKAASGWLANKFSTSGWASPLRWNNVKNAGTADDSLPYFVFQKMYGTDATTSWGKINEDGTTDIATFKLDLIDPENIDTTITIARADISLYNDYDVDYCLSAGQSQLGYSTVASDVFSPLNVEPLTIKVGGSEEPPVDDNTVAFEGFTGTKEDGVTADGSVSVAAKKSFTTSEDGTSEILWTVTLDDGNDTKKYHTSTVDFAGGADYTLGMVINGLAANLVKTIEAVLQ